MGMSDETALSLQPKYAGPWADLGDAQAASGDFAGAISSYDKAIALEPAFGRAILARAAAEEHLAGTPATTGTAPPVTTTAPPTEAASVPVTAVPATTRAPLAPWVPAVALLGALLLLRRL